MGKLKTTTYELRDVAIMQAPVSFCNHRGDVDNKVIICGRSVYPIFVAPMASVTNESNWKTWIQNDLTPVVPRSIGQRLSFEERMEIAKQTFVSISLKEAQTDMLEYFNKDHSTKLYICIDIAHGTLSALYSICKQLKDLFGDKIEIMTGNVANLDDVYSFYANAGIDWVRCGVGGGSRCTSSANLGIHVGMATLLDKLNESRKSYMHSHNGSAPTKIIADGGISNFDDINKAIALGADGVMCGKLIAETEEACGEIFYAKNLDEAINRVYINKDDENSKPFREYYGMSTKRAQKETGGAGNKTSEGISRPVEVKYSIAKWVDNMQSYLRSAMTYTNSRTIKEMQENSQLVILGGTGDLTYRK